MRAYLLILVSTIGLLCLASSCVTSEETGRSQLNLMPDRQMNALGEQAYKEILAKGNLSKKPGQIQEIRRIGQRIANASGAGFDWEFNVIDEPKTVNAFCLPGGKVAVYTGILPVAENNAALATIMGHEVAHAVLRHSAERMSQQMIIQLGMAGASLSFKDSKYRDMIAAMLGVGLQYGVSLPFSRFHEAEADRIGLEYMAKAGYDPNEAIPLWERMGAAGGRPPEFLSTHPDPLRRARELGKQLPKALALYHNASQREATKAL